MVKKKRKEITHTHKTEGLLFFFFFFKKIAQGENRDQFKIKVQTFNYFFFKLSGEA